MYSGDGRVQWLGSLSLHSCNSPDTWYVPSLFTTILHSFFFFFFVVVWKRTKSWKKLFFFGQRQKKPKLFWVSAIGPIITVLVGCTFAYFAHVEKHGIPIVSNHLFFFFVFLYFKTYIYIYIVQVGHLKKGINPSSINRLNFDPKHISATVKTGMITAILALAVST